MPKIKTCQKRLAKRDRNPFERQMEAVTTKFRSLFGKKDSALAHRHNFSESHFEHPDDPDHYLHKLNLENRDGFEEIVVSYLTQNLDCHGEKLERIRGPYQQLYMNHPDNNQTGSTSVLQLNNDLVQRISAPFEHVKANAQTKGLFRQAGSASRRGELMRLLLSSECPQLDLADHPKYNAHDSVGVIKTFLKQLVEPLLVPTKYYDCHLQIASLQTGNDEKRLETIQLLLLLLPPLYRVLLRALFLLLRHITLHTDDNLMTPDALAIVIAPTIIWPAGESINDITVRDYLSSHVAFMIRKTPDIFTAPKAVCVAAQSYYRSMRPEHRDTTPFAAPSNAVKRTPSKVERTTKMETQAQVDGLLQHIESNFDKQKWKKKVESHKKLQVKASNQRQEFQSYSHFNCFNSP